MCSYVRILLLLLFLPFVGNTQSRDVCQRVVEQFYVMLYKETVSIDQFSKVYLRASPYSDALQFLEDSLQASVNGLLARKRESRIDPTSTPSFVFRKTIKHFQVLTHGLSLPEMKKVIDKGVIYDEEVFLQRFYEITFPNGDYISFALSKEPPLIIVQIWLSDGQSFSGLTDGFVEKFKRPGIIQDPDGFVNIRAGASHESPIIGQLHKNDLFFYTPTNTSDWWLIYKEDAFTVLGYIHKSRILQYKDFPLKLQRKVHQLRDGC